MSKITQIEPQKKTPHRFNIFLDGQFAFGADEDLIVEYRLTIGKEIDASFLEKLLYEAEVGKLMQRMYGLFSIRQRSEKEVRDYFRIKNQEAKIKEKEQISDLTIDLVIKKLKQKELLNDKAFAKAWVEGRRRSKNKGSIALKYELMAKGIDRIIINELLTEESPEDEKKLAEQALDKKIISWKNLEKVEFRKKSYAFLARRGFGFDVISEIVEKTLKKIYN